MPAAAKVRREFILFTFFFSNFFFLNSMKLVCEGRTCVCMFVCVCVRATGCAAVLVHAQA